METNLSKDKDNKEHDEHHVAVAVVTTAGSYPEEGFEKVAIQQKIRIFLKKAADKLEIKSTEGWIAKADNKTLDPERSYAENNLTGEITIDFGPPEGGGGMGDE